MNKLPVTVVYKGTRKNAKLKIETFENITVDDVLSTAKRAPLIPYEYEILKIGVGHLFEQKFKEEFNQ